MTGTTGTTGITGTLRDSILNRTVSCFRNYFSVEARPVNLLTWLCSAKYADKVSEIRAIDDKEARDRMKAQLPAITPCGVFSVRSREGITAYSGFVQFDIDFCEQNAGIENWETLSIELRKIKNIAYCGQSVSGRGYWGLVPVTCPEMGQAHFEALKNCFSKLGIAIDPAPSNVASLRGYSYDPNAYFNHHPESFSLKAEPRSFRYRGVNTPCRTKLLEFIGSKLETASPGYCHKTRFNMGRLVGGYISGGIMDESDVDALIDMYLAQYQTTDNGGIQKKEIRAIKDGVKCGRKSPIFSLNGKGSFLRKNPPSNIYSIHLNPN